MAWAPDKDLRAAAAKVIRLLPLCAAEVQVEVLTTQDVSVNHGTMCGAEAVCKPRNRLGAVLSTLSFCVV